MDDILKLIGTALGVAAAGVGILLTVDQLTARSRLRRTETWAKDALKDETNEHRKRYLYELHIRSVAGVVGTLEVPLRYFVDAVITAAITGWVIISSLSDEQRELTSQRVITSVLLGLLLNLTSLRRAVRLYLERRRIVNDYIVANSPVVRGRVDLVSQMEIGTRWEFAAGAGFAVALTLGYMTVAVFLRGAPDLGVLLGSLTFVAALVPWKFLYEHGRIIVSPEPPATDTEESAGTVG